MLDSGQSEKVVREMEKMKFTNKVTREEALRRVR